MNVALMKLLDDIRPELEDHYKMLVIQQARSEKPDVIHYGPVLRKGMYLCLPIPTALLRDNNITIQDVANNVATWTWVETARPFTEDIKDQYGVVIYESNGDHEVLYVLCMPFSKIRFEK